MYAPETAEGGVLAVLTARRRLVGAAARITPE